MRLKLRPSSRDARPFARERVTLIALAGVVLVQAFFMLSGTKGSAWPFVFGGSGSASSGSLTARAADTVGTAGSGRANGAGTEARSGRLAGDVALASPPTTAYLAVRTQPSGAEVSLDGRRLGLAPVTVPEIEAGDHTIAIRSGNRTVEHQLRVAAGEVVSLLVPLARTPVAAESGSSVAVHAPIELRVFEGDRLLGTSQMARVPLSSGTHRLQLRNDAVGFQDDRIVTVRPGSSATIDVQIPKQRVAINAVPWAEVWVDGARVGETPIGNLTLALGPHDIVLRHPQLGEKTVSALVKANEPGRISVDMRK